MTISSGEIRRNMSLLLDGEVYTVLEWQHRKPPKAPPTLTLKVRHVKSGNVYEKKVQGNRPLTRAPVEKSDVQYLYFDGSDYTFMDNETFDQFAISPEMLSDVTGYLVEGDSVDVLFYEGEPIAVELPPHVNLTVQESEPAIKGNTATGATKQVVMNTGLTLNVPLFIEKGEVLKVNTRTGEYVERV